MANWKDVPLQSLAEYLEDPLKGDRAERRTVRTELVHRYLDLEKAARERLDEFQQQIAVLRAQAEEASNDRPR